MSFVSDAATLSTLAGGQSVVDLPRLSIENEEQARAFLLAYGYNIESESEVEKLWYFYRRALVFLEERLGYSLDEMPAELRDRKTLVDLWKPLVWASDPNPDRKDYQRWSCALLRVMHVFVHAESDLFQSFSEEIQKQILTPFQSIIFTEGATGTTILKSPREGGEEVQLVGFEVKPFKTSASTVIKLLAKPDAVAMKIFDRLGVRFVTKNMLDGFRVLHFLVRENLVSFPHVMPDQSTNTLYPLDLFTKLVQDPALASLSNEELNSRMEAVLLESKDKVQWLKKENSFSGDDYRFIKFIARRMIRIPMGDKKGEFSFFFPFEVQVIDQDSFAKVQSGPSEHQRYKDRQKEAARRRLFPQGTA